MYPPLASLADIKMLLAKNLISETRTRSGPSILSTIWSRLPPQLRARHPLPLSMDRDFLTRARHFILLRDGLICDEMDSLDCGGIVRGDEADTTSGGVDVLFFRTGF
jgi:hypothetical protein